MELFRSISTFMPQLRSKRMSEFLIKWYIDVINKGRTERGGGATAPHYFLQQSFFPRKIGTHKIFACEEHMRLEFIYWTRHKWQKVDSFFSFCHFSSKLSYHSYQQRVCKIMFPIRTFIKTNSNLMCGSFLLNFYKNK